MAKTISAGEQPQFREIVHNGVTVGIQLDFNVMIRIYMISTTPQRFGVRILRELPETLSRKDVRGALGISDFDRFIIRESSHSPLEADLTLFRGKEIVGRYSVKASPSGNVDYIVKSWRSERSSNDLIAIIPLEGRKNSEVVYYVALILVPKVLKNERPSRIKAYLRNVLDAKMESEELDRLWPTDFVELTSAMRDHQILRVMEDLLKKQDEIIKKFGAMIDILKKIYEKIETSQEQKP